MTRCITAILAAILLASVSACARIVRDATYLRATAEFTHAKPREVPVGPGACLDWRVDVTLPDGTAATIVATRFYGSATVKYSDESGERRLYTYRDFSVTRDLRIDGTTLYVSWVHSLFRTRYFLLVYDLRARKPILKRRVDPDDLQTLVKTALR
jgi:hypothetical protein